MHRHLVYTLALALTITQPLSAQSEGPVFLELTIGPGAGRGGRHGYYDAGMVAAELTLGARSVFANGMTRINALTVGGQSSLGMNDACRLVSVTDARCSPEFPGLAHVGGLVGLQQGGPRAAVRALAGPAAYFGSGSPGAGGQFQVDAAAGFAHLALLLAARGSLVVRFTGETLYLASLGFGLRIH